MNYNIIYNIIQYLDNRLLIMSYIFDDNDFQSALENKFYGNIFGYRMEELNHLNDCHAIEFGKNKWHILMKYWDSFFNNYKEKHYLITYSIKNRKCDMANWVNENIDRDEIRDYLMDTMIDYLDYNAFRNHHFGREYKHSSLFTICPDSTYHWIIEEYKLDEQFAIDLVNKMINNYSLQYYDIQHIINLFKVDIKKHENVLIQLLTYYDVIGIMQNNEITKQWIIKEQIIFNMFYKAKIFNYLSDILKRLRIQLYDFKSSDLINFLTLAKENSHTVNHFDEIIKHFGGLRKVLEYISQN